MVNNTIYFICILKIRNEGILKIDRIKRFENWIVGIKNIQKVVKEKEVDLNDSGNS